MNLRTAALVLVAPAALAAPLTGPDLTFSPAAGSSLRKQLSWTYELTAGESTLTFHEQEMSAGTGIVTTRSHKVVLLDHFEQLIDGRPAMLERTFETVERTMSNENIPDEVRISNEGDYTSELQGYGVRFAWDEDAEEYEARWVDEDSAGDDEWLEELTEDVDLRGFLPSGKEAAWDVEIEALMAALAPGGDLRLDPTEDTDDDMPDGGVAIRMPSLSPQDLFDLAEGEVRARRVQDEDDGDIVVIRFEAELNCEADVTELLVELEERSGRTPQDYSSATAELSITGEGVLRWNVASGCFASFEFEAEVESDLDAEWTLEQLGTLQSFSTRTGSMNYEFTSADA